MRRHSLARLNTTSLLMPARQRRAVRTVTNIGTRPEYFSVTTRGFTSHRVRVRPLAVRLAPGESADFTITVSGPSRARPARRRHARLARRPRGRHPRAGRPDPLTCPHTPTGRRPRGTTARERGGQAQSCSTRSWRSEVALVSWATSTAMMVITDAIVM